MKKSILVTGGAGYIGSIVVEQLVLEKYHVIVIDNLSEGNKQALSTGVEQYIANYGDTATLLKIFTNFNIDTVIHLGALANVPDSVINPIDYYLNNVSNTIVLLNTMNSFNVKKIIFSSTAAIYGEPIQTLIEESHPYNPKNPYGHSKLMVEQIIKDMSIAYKFKYLIFRYFCAAGATKIHGESRRSETHLIPIIIDQVLGKRLFVPVFGNTYNTHDGTGVRDYIHVSDIAAAHIIGMKNIDEIYNLELNLGSGLGYSVMDVIKTAQEEFNFPITFKILNERLGDPARLIASNSKAQSLLHWKNKYNLKDILKTSFEWRKNPLY